MLSAQKSLSCCMLTFALAWLVTLIPNANAQPSADPEKLLAEAERLAWFKSWAKAEPIYAEAEKLFAQRGDERNALYARVGKIRGQLPRRPVAQVSQELEDILGLPIAQSDEPLRLRCLTIKGETEEDFDPTLAVESWSEALQIAKRLNDARWVNRAQGELGVIAGLQGDMNAAIMQLGTALKVAETNGDTPSVVRWMTIFGHGFVQFGRTEGALVYYDKALEAANASQEIGVPVMTYLGKGEALAELNRFGEAEKLLTEALAMAMETGALGYQAELKMKLGLIASKQGKAKDARSLLEEASDLAGQTGGHRLLAEAKLELARIQRSSKDLNAASKSLNEGTAYARNLNEPFLLPKLLGEHASLRLEQGNTSEARELLEEATDILESMLAKTSSPWLKSRVFGVMDQVFLARLDLEGSTAASPAHLFAVVEQARGRVLAEMLLSRASAKLQSTPESIAGERQLAELQSRLYEAKTRKTRKALLDEIFFAEARMAPAETRRFHSEMVESARKPVTLKDVQETLHPDETLVEFAITRNSVYGIEITAERAAVHQLGPAAEVVRLTKELAEAIEKQSDIDRPAAALGRILFGGMSSIRDHDRITIVPDGPLHRIPAELLRAANGKPLLETHVISYAPSASVFSIIRRRPIPRSLPRLALAVASSPEQADPNLVSDASLAPIGKVARGIFDVDGTSLPPLPAAADEARSVASLLGAQPGDILIGASATESTVKRRALGDYRILHFAAHGLVSSKYPERSALLLRKSDGEDGLLQAREILRMNLRSDLVTLSACDTGSGNTFGQEGVANLVRPVLAAGSRSVLASLWGADDTFSLMLMKAFYRNLAEGIDAGEALRQAKLAMIKRFGPNATPRLWSGYLLYGDSTASIPTIRSAAR